MRLRDTKKENLVKSKAIELIVNEGLEGFSMNKLAKACKKNGGTWLDKYWECEYAPQQWCASAGGRFDECASACRHSPDPATPCTMQCVPICTFSDNGVH